MLCYLPIGFVNFFIYWYGFSGNILSSPLCVPPFLSSLFGFSENKKGGLLHFGVKSPPKITIKLTLIVITLFNCSRKYLYKSEPKWHNQHPIYKT